MHLGSLLETAAGAQPEKTVLLCDERTMSFRELDESSSDLARWLLDAGLEPQDRVLIQWSNSIEAVQLYFAVFKAGLIAVPVNTRLKPPEVAYIHQHSEARLCFSEPLLADVARQAGVTNPVTALPEVRHQTSALPAVDPETPAAILYTSGTTARPKGVVHTHRTLIASARLTVTAGRLEAGGRALLMTPLAHASGLLCSLLPAVCAGASIVLLRAFSPAAVLDAIERFRCTYFASLPALVQLIANEQEARPRRVDSMRAILVGGDSVPTPLFARVESLFSTPLFEGLGMTEAVPIIVNSPAAQRPGSLGLPVEAVEVRIVDSEDRNVPDGESGEIVVRSPGNCIGYWKDADATDALLRGGWLHTGDIGRRDSDGYFWFKGRKKEIIVRGGSNISPQEVEEALYLHPAVAEAGVIGMPDPLYGERVIAFLSLRPDAQAAEEEILEHMRQRLSDHKVPERLIFMSELPKGPTGKVHRRGLKEMALADPRVLEKQSAQNA
jgi:long-chain acyl-CoA synthetase